MTAKEELKSYAVENLVFFFVPISVIRGRNHPLITLIGTNENTKYLVLIVSEFKGENQIFFFNNYRKFNLVSLSKASKTPEFIEQS